MPASLLIRNARIVDGTGAPPRNGDVSVVDGRIAAIGEGLGGEGEVIDAAGRVLAPGFIDIHTHFDPQLCWDRLATPSLEHGVTTVVIGNCSLSLAPVRAEGADKVVSMFGVIEDIKKRTFDAAVPFTWESFPEYLDHIRDGLGINVGALMGHSALRYYVMGAESQERAASDDEIAEMCRILEEAMAAGCLGLSASYVDMDENMKPVPSRLADLREKIALAQAMAKSGRGVYQVVPYFPELSQQLDNIRELGEISRASGVMCSLQPILSSPQSPVAKESIEALEACRDSGARVFGQVMPRCFDLAMRLSETTMLLFVMPTWKATMDLPHEERVARFGDPARRQAYVDEMNGMLAMGGAIPFMKVGDVYSEANEAYRGRTLGEISEAEARSVPDVILDLSLADDLRTEFRLEGVMNADKESVATLIDHPLCHFGASDAGAHVTQFCGTGDTTHLLEHYVRESGRMTLERAVHRMTGEVAEAWGLRDRGTLEVGKAADLVLFDPDTVGLTGEEFVDDFPGEAHRYVRHATGYAAVIVNGEVVRRDGVYTEARAGQVV